MDARPLVPLILWANAAGCAQIATADEWPVPPAASSSGGSSGSSQSGGSGGSGGAGTCNQTTIDRVHDDFEDDNANLELWNPYAVKGATVDPSDGVLTVGLVATAGLAYAGFKTLDPYDVRGCAVELAVLSVAGATAPAETYLAFDAQTEPPTERVMIKAQGSVLYFQHWGRNGMLSTDEIEYEPKKHRLWRLVVVFGQVAGQWSEDGSAWIGVGSIEAPPYLASAYVNLGAGTFREAASDPGTARFDDVRATQP